VGLLGPGLDPVRVPAGVLEQGEPRAEAAADVEDGRGGGIARRRAQVGAEELESPGVAASLLRRQAG
jgi:hypothetical protein